jgi:hypothetical protein
MRNAGQDQSKRPERIGKQMFSRNKIAELHTPKQAYNCFYNSRLMRTNNRTQPETLFIELPINKHVNFVFDRYGANSIATDCIDPSRFQVIPEQFATSGLPRL